MQFSNVLSALLLGSGFVCAAHDLQSVEKQISSYLGHQDNSKTLPIGCHVACGFLKFVAPKEVALPSSPEYDVEEADYWSQLQANVKPSCHFSPKSAAQVSLAVLVSRVTQCKFAVKSGGHAAFAGASNIENGITIDLANLNQIVVSDDKTQTSVGAGNVWYNVYKHLQPMGLTTIGGRVSAIGVGGLTLGGGISFFSSRHGWACDNVNAFEVVFADGSIQNVTHSSKYSDLYWALRGGGNNFGIVTSFDLATYPQGNMWAGSQTFIHNKDTEKAINNAFYHFANNAPSDPDAQIITAYAYAQTQGVYVIASDLQYAKPEPNPPILQNFTSVPGPVADTLRVVDLPGLTAEFNATNPNGFRKTYWTFTVRNNAELMSEMVDIYIKEVEKIKDAKGVVPSLVFQPISKGTTQHFSKNGGNPLSLAGQGPLNLVNIDISWSDAADDERVFGAAQNILDASVAAAKTRGLDHPYLYQNYASLQQDVFASYGRDNLAKLRAIRAKYDPHMVFQKLQPGYFKLG